MIQGGATDSSSQEGRRDVKEDTSSENAGSASCSSSEAAQISCLELDAWIRDDDEAMDCMMMLPDVDSAEAEDQSMRRCEEQLKSCTCCDSQECRQMIFCRSSSNCSSTFPDNGDSCGDQETLELSLPDDFFDDKQIQQAQQEISPTSTLPPLRESMKHHFTADLKKIIVKKPVMDKAVERLGGGRRGAMRLWNIIQVWLRYQQQAGSSPLEMLPFENFGNFVNGNGVGFQTTAQEHRNVQNPQVFRDPNAVVCPSFGELGHNMGFQPQQQQSSVFCSYGDPANPPSVVPDCTRTSAASTRAARKSRMARQRRHRAGAGSGTVVPPAAGTSPATPCSWPSSGFGSSAATATRDRDVKPAGRVGCEKSAKFLLQKELKPSDVGNLGRIVLPKKEAEIHLPYLNLREGITIAMEDMVTTHTWHFRYRFWPNNKSRMYLLEGTGEFVKTHQLKEGDLLQIHRDCKTGKYMIYGKTVVKQQRMVEEDSLSAASTVSEDASEPYGCSDGVKSYTVEQEVREDGIERLSSVEEMGSEMACEMGDEFIEEILGMVETEEPSSPESGREDV